MLIMSWGKTIGISIIVSLLLWLALGYLSGDFMLLVLFVPEKAGPIVEWSGGFLEQVVVMPGIVI